MPPELIAAPADEGRDWRSVLVYCYVAFALGLLLGGWLAKDRARRRINEMLAEL